MTQRTLVFRYVTLFVLLTLVLPGSMAMPSAEATGYTISGQVTDSEGSPVQGVMLTARSESGAGAVLVKNEAGNPVSGAQVFRGESLAGITGADGMLTIPDLAAGNALVARQLVTEVATNKNNHSQDSSQNWGYRIYITSLDIPVIGEPAPLVVTDTATVQTLMIEKSNTLIGFNIVASLEWDASAAYLSELQQGFKEASKYLYDATDGQMLFERVTIFENQQQWADADYHFWATNQLRPKSPVGTILESRVRRPRFGREWLGPYTESDGFRAFIHEFGHYGLCLWDSYTRLLLGKIRLEDAHCTSANIRFEQYLKNHIIGIKERAGQRYAAGGHLANTRSPH